MTTSKLARSSLQEKVYKSDKAGEFYILSKDGSPLLTPMGRQIRTRSRVLADRLASDLTVHGEDPSNPVSLVAFHYAMTDFFAVQPRTQLEQSVASGIEPENDWTFRCPTAIPEAMKKWLSFFGTYSSRVEQVKKWLSSLSLVQLCAVGVIGRALESVNIPFTVAMTDPGRELRIYAEQLNRFYPYVSSRDLLRYFKNFDFYFSLEISRDQ